MFRSKSLSKTALLWKTSQKRNASSIAQKRVVITGASRGIGLAIAQRFALSGASCVLVSRNLDALNSALKTLPQNHESNRNGEGQGGEGHVHVARAGDISDRTFWESLREEFVLIPSSPYTNGISCEFGLIATVERHRDPCELCGHNALFPPFRYTAFSGSISH
jgi:hypothetical protein